MLGFLQDSLPRKSLEIQASALLDVVPVSQGLVLLTHLLQGLILLVDTPSSLSSGFPLSSLVSNERLSLLTPGHLLLLHSLELGDPS